MTALIPEKKTGSHRTGRWDDPRASVIVLEKRRTSCP